LKGEENLFIVRLFEEKDEKQVKKIASRAFVQLGLSRLVKDKSLSKRTVGQSYSKEAEGYLRKVFSKDENLVIIVAEEGETITGYVILGVDNELSELFGFKWGSIKQLAVDPDWWGKGVGSKLVEEGLNHLKKMGVKQVDVFTAQNNIAAIKVYEKNGFKIIHSGVVLSQFID
jgi:ribosomal protein S18 acetylase RimI-like enzyme